MKSKKLLLFKLNILALFIMILFLLFRLFFNNDITFYTLIIIALFLSISFIMQLLSFQKNIYKLFSKIEHSVGKTKCNALNYHPSPVVIVDEENLILWYNTSFNEKIFNNIDAFGLNICEVFNIDPENLKSKNLHIFHQKSEYRVNIKNNFNENSANLKILFFEDITEYSTLLEQYNNQKPTVALINIDNYEDLFQNAKESDKANVQAAIEKLFEEFTQNTNSLLRKLSKDKFIAVLEEVHLLELINTRFEILDKARSIIVNDHMNITLSIGVGRGASSLAESELFAKQALDMALGRGGDQAALKTDFGFEFFGGVSKGVEKHSKIKTRIISNALQELILSSENIFVMGHKYGDLDSIGAAIGLVGAINLIGKSSFVVVDPVNNLAKTLIDRLKYYDNSCIFIPEKDAISLFNEKSLLIIVDTHKPDFLESVDLYKLAKNIVVIDHHRKSVKFIDDAVIFHHEPYASSASEMVTELIQYFKNLNKIPSYFADALLAGIMLDTKNFVVRTGVRTFEAAAFLRKMGADTIAVKDLFSNSIEMYINKINIVSTAKIYDRFAIASVENATDATRISAPQACDELLNIQDVDASFVIYNLNNIINISARSFGSVNVQLIMEKLKGGGHQTMAATQLANTNIEEATKNLISAIDEYQAELSKN